MERTRVISAFSLWELLATVAIVSLVGFVVLLKVLSPPTCAKSPRIKCVSNLKNIGIAVRIFETDGFTPGDVFRSNQTGVARSPAAAFMRILSNELSTPKLLVCPSDQGRTEASQNSFSASNFTDANISYFASISANENIPDAFLAGDRNLQVAGNPLSSGIFPILTNTPLSWTRKIHNEQGNIAIADGSVQQVSNARLPNLVSQQGIATNLLLIP